MRANMPGGARKTITSLAVMVKATERGLWPTPTAWLGRREAHAKGNSDRFHDPARSNELSDAVDAAGTPGSLNPTWVEWLMGFTPGHTDLPHWVTRSSRKSLNSSLGRSSNGRGSK
jgi:hypothetical protein